MNSPKVSILIPLYNAEEYITETIDSCLNQTYDNIEIIIVDDGSTDLGLEIAKKYENKYGNIKVETQKNSGASSARNKAFEYSTGEFIQYLDADDILHTDKISLQMDILKGADTYTIIFGKYGSFKKNIKNIVWKNLSVNKNYDDTKQFLLDLWKSGQAIIPHMWLTPRNLIEKSGGWDETLSRNDDGEFFSRVLFSANKILFVEESVGYYRKDNANSLSSKISKKALQSSLRSFDMYVDLMKNHLDEPQVRKSLALVYSRRLYFIQHEHPAYKDLIQETEGRIQLLGFKRPFITRNRIVYFITDIFGKKSVLQLKKTIKKMFRH